MSLLSNIRLHLHRVATEKKPVIRPPPWSICRTNKQGKWNLVWLNKSNGNALSDLNREERNAVCLSVCPRWYLRHFQLTCEFLASHHLQHTSYQKYKINGKKENHALIKNKNEQILLNEDFFPSSSVQKKSCARAPAALCKCSLSQYVPISNPNSIVPPWNLCFFYLDSYEKRPVFTLPTMQRVHQQFSTEFRCIMLSPFAS